MGGRQLDLMSLHIQGAVNVRDAPSAILFRRRRITPRCRPERAERGVGPTLRHFELRLLAHLGGHLSHSWLCRLVPWRHRLRLKIPRHRVATLDRRHRRRSAFDTFARHSLPSPSRVLLPPARARCCVRCVAALPAPPVSSRPINSTAQSLKSTIIFTNHDADTPFADMAAMAVIFVCALTSRSLARATLPVRR